MIQKKYQQQVNKIIKSGGGGGLDESKTLEMRLVIIKKKRERKKKRKKNLVAKDKIVAICIYIPYLIMCEIASINKFSAKNTFNLRFLLQIERRRSPVLFNSSILWQQIMCWM